MLHTILAGSLTARPLPTFVSSSANSITTGTSIVVTAPTGIQDGDLLVAVSRVSTNTTLTPPTGFNLISSNPSASNTGVYVATKVASSESGNYTFTYGTSASLSAAILVYRNATKVNTVGSPAFSSTTTATASSITPTYPGVLLAVYGAGSGTISSGPSGMTQRVARTTASVLYVYDLNPQSATATGTKAATWGTAAGITSMLLQVSNENEVTPTFVASANTQNGATGSSLVINKPTGTQENDLMIAVMSGSAAATWTGDTGWTEPADQGAAPSLRVAYKTAGASEPSSYTFTASVGTGTLSGCILTYRFATYDTIAGAFTTGANPLLLASISPSSTQSLLIACGARAAISITLGTPTSMTARVTDSDATSPSFIVCDQPVAIGPTGIRWVSTGSSTSVAGIMLAIKPTRNP